MISNNHRTRLLVLASLSLLTTLLALSGIGKGSAGAVAQYRVQP